MFFIISVNNSTTLVTSVSDMVLESQSTDGIVRKRRKLILLMFLDETFHKTYEKGLLGNVPQNIERQ